MVDLQYYVHPIPDDDQVGGEGRQRPNNTLQGLLGNDAAVADRISSPPGEVRVQAQHRGKYADLMGKEVEELAESTAFSPLPLFAPSADTAADGYYVVNDAAVGPADQRESRVQNVELTLRRSGTQSSHYRALSTGPEQVSHPFGTDSTATIAIPAAATDSRWVNPETGTAEPASSTGTTSLEFDAVATYNLSDASFWATGDGAPGPILVYDVPYDKIGAPDVRVWDTRGLADRDDADGLPQWQKVFTSTHSYDGKVVVSTGLFRLTFDPNNSVSAEEWDGSSWVAVSTGTSSWSLLDVDIGHRNEQRLGPARVDALTRWVDTDGTQHPLDMTLRRGASRAQFYRVPDSTSSVPTGLQDLLNPLASGKTTVSGEAQTIRASSEVDEI